MKAWLRLHSSESQSDAFGGRQHDPAHNNPASAVKTGGPQGRGGVFHIVPRRKFYGSSLDQAGAFLYPFFDGGCLSSAVTRGLAPASIWGERSPGRPPRRSPRKRSMSCLPVPFWHSAGSVRVKPVCSGNYVPANRSGARKHTWPPAGKPPALIGWYVQLRRSGSAPEA